MKHILLVEDHPDMTAVLRTLFTNDGHEVATACNGRVALEDAKSNPPALMVIDAMMPEMDGFSLCKHLSADPLLKAIPRIMLTAKSDNESRILGLESGATFYLTKPFNPDELVLIAGNLLQLNKSQKQRTAQSINRLSSQLEREPESKSEFQKRLEICLNQVLRDPKVGMDQISDKMHLSKSQLYRKCQIEFNCSTLDLLNKARMELGWKLLTEEKHSVADTAFQCGFESPSYFTQKFKKHFGKKPSEI